EVALGQGRIAIAVAGGGAREVERDVEFRAGEIGGVIADRRLERAEATLEAFALEAAGESERAARADGVVGGDRGCRGCAEREREDQGFHGMSPGWVFGVRRRPNGSMRSRALSRSTKWCSNAPPTCAASAPSKT